MEKNIRNKCFAIIVLASCILGSFAVDENTKPEANKEPNITIALAFTKDFYEADLTNEKDLIKNGANVTFNPEIALSHGTTKDLQYVVTYPLAAADKSDFTQYFEIKAKDDKVIDVKIKNWKDNVSEANLRLVLEAKNSSASARTYIDLKLPSGTPTPDEAGGMSAWWWVLIIAAIIVVVGGLYYYVKRR